MLDEAAVGYRLVLTKADKIKASELAAVLAATVAEARKHPAAFPAGARDRGGEEAWASTSCARRCWRMRRAELGECRGRASTSSA